MTAHRVLLATGDPEVATTLVDLGRESGDFTVVRTATNSNEALAALDAEVDVVVLHEDLAPVPAMDLARELSVRVPDTGMVLLSANPSQELLDAALRAGFRGIAHLPLALEEIQSTITATAEWTAAVRRRVTRGDADAGPGRMIALAGGKGGVGTTTVAVQLAAAANAADAGRRVCLVDLDLQTGDVRSLLDLSHRRSVADLVDVAHELTGRQLDDALSTHASGLRVLLPPPEGESGEDVHALAARHILTAVRTRFDVVIVDVGSVMSEAATVAVEMADQAVVVTTPDVLSMRAANRLLRLWDRLEVRTEGIRTLINRASRDSEIQSEMVRRIVDADAFETVVPAGFRSLESFANTGTVDRLDAGPVRDGIDRLADELALASARRRGRGGRGKALRQQQGALSVELVGLLPLIAVVVLALWQGVLTGFTYSLASNAAREAAQTLSVTEREDDELDRHLEAAAAGPLPPAWRDTVAVEHHQADDGDDAALDTVTVRLTVPVLAPGLDSPWQVTSQAGAFREHASRTATVAGAGLAGPASVAGAGAFASGTGPPVARP